MINVVQFGTFDVSNYGDLLFPLLAEKALLGESVRLTYASPAGGPPIFSDSVPSIATREILARPRPYDVALIGGGNIIRMSATTLEAYRGLPGMVGYGDLWLSSSLIAPKDARVIWNCPGVAERCLAPYKQIVREALQRADYLSVRDEQSRELLLDVWPEAAIAVVPDSAWNLSHVWSAEELANRYRQLMQHHGAAPHASTIAFHVNDRYSAGLSASTVGERLDRVARRLDARPLLIAIGACHGDAQYAREVAASMQEAPIVIDRPSSIVDIAACVSNSILYVGSSMHGFITAGAFGVPGICVATGKIKFDGLVQLFGNENIRAQNWSEIEDLLISSDLKARAGEMSRVAEEASSQLASHWTKIRSLIEGLRARQFTQSELNDIQVAKTGLIGILTLREQQLQERGISFCQQLRQQEVRLQDLANARTALQKQLQESTRKLQEADSREANLRTQLLEVKGKLNTVQRSLSWKITGPLRHIARKTPRATRLLSRTLRRTSGLLRETLPATNEHWGPPPDIAARIGAYQRSSKGQHKIVVYTAIFGGYDHLMVPDLPNEDIDYVCFSDGPLNGYGVWQIRPSPFYHPDPTRIARYVKTHPHELFPDHEVSIWIDSNIVIRGDVSKYVEAVQSQGYRIGFIPHPQRNCVYEEAEACKQLRKEDPSLIDLQTERYRAAGFPPQAGMIETNFFVAFHLDPQVTAFYGAWWAEIDRFTKRDQLAIGWALRETKLNYTWLLPADHSVRNHPDFTIFRHSETRKFTTPPALRNLGRPETPTQTLNYPLVKQRRLEELRDISVDIIVCVYNALEDVRLCLASAHAALASNHRLVIVNDRSNEEASTFLREFAARHDRTVLLENDTNLGYTRTANRGLAYGTADFRILLNSDTIVPRDWALKMLDVAWRSESIGIVGPLSNAASWQSIPDIKGSRGQTAINELPPSLSPADIDQRCEEWSYADLFPIVPLVHGFCFGIKKTVIERIGLFDEQNFERYYGEENDFCFRARQAGYTLAIATNTFVYHRKSRSIEEEERLIWMDKAGKRLRELHGEANVAVACEQMANHPLLQRIRIEAASWFRQAKRQLA